jgi:predicted Rossmann fold flavoprotein
MTPPLAWSTCLQSLLDGFIQPLPFIFQEIFILFPKSNSSDSVINVLQSAVSGQNFELRLHAGVKEIKPKTNGFELDLIDGNRVEASQVLIASGGSPGSAGFSFLHPLQLEVVAPVPSLFTFNVPKHPWVDLMGLSVPDARIGIENTSYQFSGPVLVTHWGFSGPAILKLSAFAARVLAERDYKYSFWIDWLPELSEIEVINQISLFQKGNGKKKPDQSPIFPIPRRLWEKICQESGLAAYFNWAEAGKKKIELAAKLLKKSKFNAQGKTTYKEEFVTSGGINLAEINPNTCQSIRYPGLYFAGEVMDVDGITGGFNFQAAWSTAFVAAQEISKKI